MVFKEKDLFYNPIKQNETHIKALKQVLGNYHTRNEHLQYESPIVFSDDCELKTKVKHGLFKDLICATF